MAELRNGSSGPEVRALQEKLTRLGFKLVVDGSYGKLTESAVIQLQKQFDFKVVDGIAGPQTKALVDEQVGKGWTFSQPSSGDGASSKSK